MFLFFHKIREELSHFTQTLFHIIAMNIPNTQLKRFFYRIRGTKIGNNVDIANFVFLEDIYPELITIGDNVDLGPRVIFATHDSSRRCIVPGSPLRLAEIVIEKNVYIGAGAIILPGVHIGEFSIIGAGSVVTRDIPPYSVAYGVPARIQSTVTRVDNP